MPEIEPQFPLELFQQLFHYLVDLGACLAFIIPILHQSDRSLGITDEYLLGRNDLNRIFCFHIKPLTYFKRFSSTATKQFALSSVTIGFFQLGGLVPEYDNSVKHIHEDRRTPINISS